MEPYCDLKAAFECIGSVTPWEGVPCRPKSAAACGYLGLPCRSYNVICSLSLILLYLVASVSDHAVDRGWQPPVPVLEILGKRPRVPQDLRISASCWYGSVAERLFGWYTS